MTVIAARTAWRLIDRMELHKSAQRRPGGAVTISRWARSCAFLYGPHLRLVSGRYRLRFRCEARHARLPSRPVLGVEVIAQNRVLLRWCDFTMDELAGDELGRDELGRGELGAMGAVVEFEVSPDLGAETGVDAPLEFRFLHLVNADLAISAVDLLTIQAHESTTATEDHWRLLGRLRPPWVWHLGRMRSVGLGVYRPKAVRPLWPKLPMTWQCEPFLRLPKGQYRLELQCQMAGPARRAGPALRLEVVTNTRIRAAKFVFSAEQLARGNVEASFEVADDIAIESGENVWFEFRISRLGGASPVLREINLRRLPHRLPVAPSANKPTETRRLAGVSARRKIVVVGNCQGGLIAEAMRRDDALARQFTTRNHYIDLPINLHEQGKRELAACDILLAQDIRDWDSYPLRAYVRPSCTIVMFPCVSFASLWPFDAFNGPDDKEARRRDYPNYEFEYFDGLLGRLRREIPDPELRFAAYKALDVPGVIDVGRLHRFEERRLSKMDAAFGGSIGAYILENFRKRRVFHTTAHPNGVILGMLLRQIAARLGVKGSARGSAPLDELARLQVPIHPRVAATLGVTWVNEGTTYVCRGETMTWEAYIRKYISYYG